MSAPHIARMETEEAELADRIMKLRAFRDQSPLYPSLSGTQRSLLAAQLQAMTCYQTVLSMRIDNDRQEAA